MATNEYLGKTDWLFITQLLRTEYSKYVKAIEGMGLSTNDFTNELKTKLDDIDTSLYARRKYNYTWVIIGICVHDYFYFN